MRAVLHGVRGMLEAAYNPGLDDKVGPKIYDYSNEEQKGFLLKEAQSGVYVTVHL